MMNLLDLTLPDPAENLALDEALLDYCEQGYPHDILRFWEPRDYFVVLGYSNRQSLEVYREHCREDGIAVLRRPSGGGTVLQGPGCLNYALILDIRRDPRLESIRQTNQWIMERNRLAVLRAGGPDACIQGDTDLAVRGIKFSGNAQRRKKTHVLFHGTFLYRFDLSYVEKYLPMPSKQPAYREERPHRDFLMNLGGDSGSFKKALQTEWQAALPLTEIPLDAMRILAKETYSRAEWIEKF